MTAPAQSTSEASPPKGGPKLIMRTEMLLRRILQRIAGKAESDSLKEMLVDYKQHFSDTNCQISLDTEKIMAISNLTL